MDSTDQKVWVKYGTGRAVEVSVPPECNVNGLIKVIKGELSVVLKDYDVSQISLHGPEEGRKEGGEHGDGEETAYRPSRLVASILTEGAGFDDENPILIRTTAQGPTASTGSPGGIDVNFKWGNISKSAVIRRDANLETLKSVAIDLWEDALLLIDFDLKNCSGDASLTDETCADFLRNGNCKIKIESCAVGFSKIKRSDVLVWAGVNEIVDDDAYFEDNILDLENEEIKNILDHVVRHIQYTDGVYGPIVRCFEASVREYIGAVLLACAMIAGDIKMSAEKSICGKRANGPLDYVMLYKKFFLLITEAKKDDMINGTTQNLAQLVASREQYLYNIAPALGKRTYMDMAGQIARIPSTGIVTSGKDWILLRYLQQNDGSFYAVESKMLTIDVAASDPKTIKEGLIKVISKITGAIRLQKDALDSVQENSRQRT